MPKREADDEEGEESKGHDGGDSDLLTKAIKHCWSDNFLDVFRSYFRKHAEVFEVMAEGRSEEHALEYQELFNEYLLIFEGKLEEFIDSEGSSINEFYTVIREHQGNPDPQVVQLFINCLLASADYDSFFNVMKKEAEKSLRKKRQLGQENKPIAGERKESDSAPPRSVPSAGEGKDSEDGRRPSNERSYK
ncbi:unnamed protein product [Scytosiphon promiscuus]